MCRSLLCASFLLIPLLCSAADKKPQAVPLLARPNQQVQIEGLQTAPVAQKCENFGWAVTVELMLRMQGVDLDQKYWVTKVDHGELCVTDMPTVDELAENINGEYNLDVKHTVRLTAKITKGAPVVPDEMIVSLREGSPWLFVWKGHPYLMTGIRYDEYIGPNNARIFQVKEIKLLDPLVAADDPQRQVSFVRERDNLADIDGTLRVQAVPVE